MSFMNTRKFVGVTLAVITLLSVSLLIRAEQVPDPNSFNRLLKPPSERNPAPPEDGIHDPEGSAVNLLQAPRSAFSKLPRSKSGDYVDWMQALDEDLIDVRFDRVNSDIEAVVMDLNIVREVKGSMPDVVYRHETHTRWLDCSNCHPRIFVPQKGANNISMAGILLGEQCGVCHGKVAFPVSECRRCHSQNKTQPVAADGAR